MGHEYELKCAACDYGVRVTEGIGMMYSPHAVFYGREGDEPLLLTLVHSQRIRDVAFGLLSTGATPGPGYGHHLYTCPKCHRLANDFYFKLTSPTRRYEPDYRCSAV